MCYICSCVGWVLDILQRLVTLCMACGACCAVCCGMLIAIGAGIAYGYNYCMSEYISHTRSDITVYMRRGQFYDDPDFEFRRQSAGGTGDARKSGGGGVVNGVQEDLSGANLTTDYQDKQVGDPNAKPLSDSWVKSQNARKYAEQLVKYSAEPKGTAEKANQADIETPVILSPTKTPSIISSKIWHKGSTALIMRKLHEEEGPDLVEKELDEAFYGDQGIGKKKENDKKQGIIPMRVWGPTRRPPIFDDLVTEEDNDNKIVYKPG